MSNIVTVKASIYNRIFEMTNGVINKLSVDTVMRDSILSVGTDELPSDPTYFPDLEPMIFFKRCCDTDFKSLEVYEIHQQFCAKTKISDLIYKILKKPPIEKDNDFSQNFHYCSCHQKFTSLTKLSDHAIKCKVAKYGKLNANFSCLKCIICFDNFNQLKDHLWKCLMKPGQVIKKNQYCNKCPTFECHFYRCILRSVKSSNLIACKLCKKEFNHPIDYFVHSTICQDIQPVQCLCQQNCGDALDLYVHVKSCEKFYKMLLLAGWTINGDFSDFLNGIFQISEQYNEIQLSYEVIIAQPSTSQSASGDENNTKNVAKRFFLPSIEANKITRIEVGFDENNCLLCHLCDVPFCNFWSLKLHYKKKHLLPNYLCTICNTKFSWKSSLVLHQLECRQ